MSKKYLIIIAVLHICNGERRQHRLPELFTRLSSNVAEEINVNPFAAAVNSVTWVPHVLAKALGSMALPTIKNPDNYGENDSQFIIEYRESTLNEDAILKIDQLISKYGFPVQTHEVKTDDGYLLTMFRIPGNGKAVFLMHGLLGSADDFVVAGRDNGLAYLLADAGYDVWMGNARGNKHSRKHLDLDPSQPLFWDFSWHEIGIYDLPAMIDYILANTHQKTLRYIGHSQGTTSFFVMASEKPEYNDKVSLMIALSPVAYMTNVRSPIVRVMSPRTFILHELTKNLGIYEFLPERDFIRSLKLLICGRDPISEIMCSNIIFLVAGYDIGQLNATNLPVVLGHIPSGASVKQFAHYGQGVLSDEFRKFDYGPNGNVNRHGVEVPPAYDLDKVVTPISLFFAESDWLAHPIDVDRLSQRLGNVVDYYKVQYKHFNHVDFFMAKDVKMLIYMRLLQVLARF